MNASRSVKKGLLPFHKTNPDSPFELASTDVIRCEVSSNKDSVFKQDNRVERTPQRMPVSFASDIVCLYAVESEQCLERGVCPVLC
jgi:hypothetical protein